MDRSEYLPPYAVFQSRSHYSSYIHTLFLAVDGNFRLQLKKKLRDQHDFHLHDGGAYFRNEDEYKKYLSEAKDYHQVRIYTHLLICDADPCLNSPRLATVSKLAASHRLVATRMPSSRA